MNIHEDLTSRNMNNGDGSNKDNPRFRDLKANNKEDHRLNNHNPNNRDSNNHRFNNPRGSNPNNGILNLRASNIRKNHNPHILKGSLKEEVQNTESRMTRSLKTLLFMTSVKDNWSQSILTEVRP